MKTNKLVVKENKREPWYVSPISYFGRQMTHSKCPNYKNVRPLCYKNRDFIQ